MKKFEVMLEVLVPSTQIITIEAVDEKQALGFALSSAKLANFKLVKPSTQVWPLRSSKVTLVE